MSPAIGRSSALQQIEPSVGLETRDRITLDLYPVLLLAEQNFKKKKKNYNVTFYHQLNLLSSPAIPNTLQWLLWLLTNALCFSSCAHDAPSFSKTENSVSRKGVTFDPRVGSIWPNMVTNPCCFLRGMTLLISTLQ